MSKLVTVIIPSYNRYESLLQAIKSVKNQTYNNIEIIVINDNSTDRNYYINKIDNIIMVHLDKNTKNIYKYACVGHVRNIGLKICSGNYISFLDDDDYFLPSKIESQVKYLDNNLDIDMCCTEGYIGNGIYNSEKVYKIYNREYHWTFLKQKLNLDNDFPNIWNLKFITTHNTIITSSIMFRKKLLLKVGLMKNLPNGYEDYDYWIRLLHYTDCFYFKQPMCYYDDSNN